MDGCFSSVASHITYAFIAVSKIDLLSLALKPRRLLLASSLRINLCFVFESQPSDTLLVSQ